MAEPMVKIYSHSQFNQLLSMFQSAVDRGEYTEKIPYDTWRKLKKMSGNVKVEYCSPFVKISYLACTSCGEEVESVVFSAKTYNNGFGRFFYDYVVKESEKMATASSIVTNITTRSDNMKMNLSDGTLYIKTDDNNWNELGTATNATISTTDAVWGYGYSDRTTTSDHTTGYPSNIGTISTITTLDDRVNWLENEIQKKVDKTEMKKENDTMMKGINFDFGPCGNTVRLSMYGMAIQNISGEWVSYNPDSKEIINVDVFNMADGGKYMYKMPVAIADVKIGDIVIHNRVPMFVTAVNENGTFEVTDVRAGEAKTVIPTRNMFGFNFMTKVVSLFGAFTDAPTADQPFGNMLPFLMLGDGNKDIDPMMLFFMMNQNGTNVFNNPMMMYFMMKDNKDFDPMLMFMMMNQNHTCQCGKHAEKVTPQI